MRVRSRRIALLIAALVLAIAFVFVLRYAARLAAIGTAYTAKVLCSEVFVSGRDPDAALASLEVDDLASLRYVKVSLDRSTRSVTASVLSFFQRRATYRDGQGCALFVDGVPPAGETVAGAPRALASIPASIDDAAVRARVESVVDSAFIEPNPERPKRTRAVVVLHHGQVVAERYAPGFGPETPLPGWSMTKSVMNALVGILVRDGQLTLGAPVQIPEWRASGDPRSHITLDQLLRMSSGLEFDEDMDDPRADIYEMLLATPDMASFAIQKPLRSAPGRTWQYSSGTSMILARVLRNLINDDSGYRTLPRRALFGPLGMTSAVLETDASGTFAGASFMYATARDWARFGQLYLQDGVWNGQRILPDGWVSYTRTPAPADPKRDYGAHFWLNVPDYHGTDRTEPPGTFHAGGHEGQFVTVVPSADVVIVRLGHTRYPDAWDHPAFVRDILAALGRK